MHLKIDRNFPSPGQHLCGLAWDGNHLWHSDGTTNRIYQLDADTGVVVRSIKCDNVRTCLGFDSQYLWQIADKPKRIRVLNPTDGAMIQEIPFSGDTESVCALYVGNHAYWIGSKATGEIEERNRETNEVIRKLNTHGSVHGMALVGNVMWYTDYPEQVLVAFDLNDENEVGRYELSGHPTGLCFDGQRLWYCDYTNHRIVAVSPTSG
ncbi:MAG: hypothetical protein K6T78_00905 [Alicyclobacillus sp.]|nr:hypothetical protein [Alicyclobacillus sp.]